jgi:hypothetical protein
MEWPFLLPEVAKDSRSNLKSLPKTRRIELILSFFVGLSGNYYFATPG